MLKRWMSQIVVPLSLWLAQASVCVAQTYTPNFDGPGLDPSLTWNFQPGFSYAVQSGTLAISYNDSGGEGQSISASVGWNPGIQGDYVARFTVDVSRLADLSQPEFMNGGPFLTSGPASVFAGPWRSGSSSYIAGSMFDPDYVGGDAIQFPAQVLDVKFVRQGDVVTEWAAPSGTSDYQLLYTAAGPEFSGPIYIALDLYYRGTGPIVDATIVYSNVSVTLMSPVPECTSAVMLMLGCAVLLLRGHARLRRFTAV